MGAEHCSTGSRPVGRRGNVRMTTPVNYLAKAVTDQRAARSGESVLATEEGG